MVSTHHDILAAVTNTAPLPEHNVIQEIVQICRRRFFKGFYRIEEDDIDRLHMLLSHQIARVLPGDGHAESIRAIADRFVAALPELRDQLAEDVEASYDGDPAATSCSEVVLCYPGIYAITNYRIAHCLDQLGVPLIPRMITEQAHSMTGIDIHPAATIGHRFMIDHGTGVVIGATARIGDNVKIYQGVTLGARSFPLDPDGNPIKGVARHPHVGNNVVIYANATILGTVTIGDGAVIGGNQWVTHDVAPGAKLTK